MNEYESPLDTSKGNKDKGSKNEAVIKPNKSAPAHAAIKNFERMVEGIDDMTELDQFENDTFNPADPRLLFSPDAIAEGKKIISEKRSELEAKLATKLDEQMSDTPPPPLHERIIFPPIESETQNEPVAQAEQHVEQTEPSHETEQPQEAIVSPEKENLEVQIAKAKSIKELTLVLIESPGIESGHAGFFSGIDLAFLIQQVSRKEAYIEEITRRLGLREKVFYLLQDQGITPHSLEYEEEEAQNAVADIQIDEPEIPASEPQAPHTPEDNFVHQHQPFFPPAPASPTPKIIQLKNGKYFDPEKENRDTKPSVFQKIKLGFRNLFGKKSK